jgi:hypothetical protein
MTYQPVHALGRERQASAARVVTRRAILAGAPLALAAVMLPTPSHAGASRSECLADVWALR